MFFMTQFLYFKRKFEKVRTKLKNVIKSFEMTLDTKHKAERTKNYKPKK